MLSSPSAAEIAERLGRALGEDALQFVGMRVEEARRESDRAAVRLWNEVARRLAGRDSRDALKAGGGDGALWALMQRIEYCRHRGMAAERKAASGSEAFREEMADVAMQWRDLALHADLLAWLSKRLAKLPDGA
jgi:hypothetical protein